MEKNRVRLRERVEGLEDRMQWQWTFWSVKQESALRQFDDLRISSLEDAGSSWGSRFTLDD